MPLAPYPRRSDKYEACNADAAQVVACQKRRLSEISLKV